MADPVTMALVAGVALKASGQVSEGMMFKAEGQAKKDIAEYNSRQLTRQAEARRNASELEDVRQGRKANIALGSQIARGGKSGTVSSVDALADTAFQFAMDRNLIMRQALVESQGLLGQAAMQRAKGQYASDIGKFKRNAKYREAAVTILGGAFAASKIGGAAAGGGGTSGAGGLGGSAGSNFGNFSPSAL